MNAGYSVVGYDIKRMILKSTTAGVSHIDDVTDFEISNWINGNFVATSDDDRLIECSIFIICVPTPRPPSGGSDLAAVEAASETIVSQLAAGSLVVLVSTPYPGTTEEIVKPIPETSGPFAVKDFALAFSPGWVGL
jgi:UDP-N-acetyl-D-mannosaminuronate dehydrogenase